MGNLQLRKLLLTYRMFAFIITGVKSVEEILTLEMSKSSRLWHQAKFLLIPCVPLMTHTQGGRFIFIHKKGRDRPPPTARLAF